MEGLKCEGKQSFALQSVFDSCMTSNNTSNL